MFGTDLNKKKSDSVPQSKKTSLITHDKTISWRPKLKALKRPSPVHPTEGEKNDAKQVGCAVRIIERIFPVLCSHLFSTSNFRVYLLLQLRNGPESLDLDSCYRELFATPSPF